MYFDATVQITQTGKNGATKKENEYYLLDAVSYTDAEKRITQEFMGTTLEWAITKLSKSKISTILK